MFGPFVKVQAFAGRKKSHRKKSKVKIFMHKFRNMQHSLHFFVCLLLCLEAISRLEQFHRTFCWKNCSSMTYCFKYLWILVLSINITFKAHMIESSLLSSITFHKLYKPSGRRSISWDPSSKVCYTYKASSCFGLNENALWN